MITSHSSSRGWRGDITALFAGIVLPLSLAPYNIWTLGLASIAAFALMLNGLNGMRSLKRSFIYGLGMFGGGVSWVYVSIHDFGMTGAPLAVILTGVFVLFLALVFALPFYFYGRFFSTSRFGQVFALPAIFVLGEWLRSWLFSGFPWLYVGYGHIETWLSLWAPIGGIFFISFCVVLTSTLSIHGFSQLSVYSRKNDTKVSAVFNISALCCILIMWPGALLLKNIQWTTPIDSPQSVAIMQPNIPLEMKWNPIFHPSIFTKLEDNADKHWDKDIQVWPEAAIPSLFTDAQHFIEPIDAQAKENKTNIISGVLYDNEQAYEVYNAIIGLGLAQGTYFKQKLVPFGEYVPFEDQLRGLINFFDLPSSVIKKGPFIKNPLFATTKQGTKYEVTPLICYEVVYPDFVAKNARTANLMVTISNDAWFGASNGPLQHVQMAQMRALENQKPLIRSTNTGVSAIIDSNGHYSVKGPQFKQAVITGEVQLREGSTPFAKLNSWPILLLCLLICSFSAAHSIRQKKHKD